MEVRSRGNGKRSFSDDALTHFGHHNLCGDHHCKNRRQYQRNTIPLKQVDRGVERHAQATRADEAQHGGFAHDDTNVMLLVSSLQLSPGSVTSPVETAQIAPTILKVLGVDPEELKAVQLEHTQVLPGVQIHD